MAEAAEQYDLVVVANRLPVDRVTDPDGTVRWTQSPGGLVTAMESVMVGREGAWVGWSGDPGEAPEPFDENGMHLHAVALSAEEVEDHYEGFSNETLWPLYHDVIVPPRYRRRWYEGYRKVNHRFAVAAAELAAPGATVWVHDYQMQLVPAMLRTLRPDVRIGWFDHIPFPSVELFAQLPWRRQMVEGLLGADLLGFQRRADAENFLRVCRRLLGLSTRGDTVTVPTGDGERTVRAAGFPISIDAASLEALARQPQVIERSRQIRKDLGNPKRVLLGVDRLDYTKGLRHRLKAYEELLIDGILGPPETVLVQVATPSRERVSAYIELREQVEVTVGRANGDFGHLGQPAIHYLHQSHGREEMAALYLAADVMLVTPLRDGMNLVAKEYVTCRHDEGGALVLSEFTGAAHELDRSFLCNPHDIDGLKVVIRQALDADPRDKRRRMRALRRRVRDNDVQRWADTFLRALDHAPHRPTTGRPEVPTAGEVPPAAVDWSPDPDLADALQSLLRRRPVLLAVDFDGVLAPIVDEPSAARALDGTADLLAALAEADGVHVALVSGRALGDLREVAAVPAESRLLLVGSHGAEFSSDDAGSGLDDAAADRLALVRGAFDAVAARYDGVHVETKPAGVVLHTRRADRADAAAAATAALEAADAPGCHVTQGKEVVEVSVVEAGKGVALDRLRAQVAAEGVLYAGDDVTDENAFAVLRPGDVGIKVGDGETLAAYRLPDPPAVQQLLRHLVALAR